jgi:primosomal protein N' (replication factor Y)
LNDEAPRSLRIAVAVPVKDTYHYLVPESLSSKIGPGRRVLVPFKNRRVTGYILEKLEGENREGLKEILEVLDSEPLFHEKIVPFFEWIAEYYMHPIGQVIQSVLPGGLNKGTIRIVSLTKKGMDILNRLPPDSEEREILSWIKKYPRKGPPWPYEKIRSLHSNGWLIIEEAADKRHIGPLLQKFVRPKSGIQFKFLETIFQSDSMMLSDLKTKFSNSSYLIRKWTQKGILELYSMPVYKNPAGEIMFRSQVPLKLYKQQKVALTYIQDYLDKGTFSTWLLHGVTGSGKTEVYNRAIEYAIKQGRQAIFLAPEISLASYMEALFKPRLGNRIAIYHSGLSQRERIDQWLRMVRGDVDLVIGARSALFAPLFKLGLIVVDEEYDPSYKQEQGPRYQARDAAVMRAKMENTVVILGSGTPSVQSFHNATQGKYHLITMSDRVDQRPLPIVEIIDMKSEDNKEIGNEMLSSKLKGYIDQNMDAGDQSILFLNRRGFHRVFICRSCGQSIRCPNCEVALTHHFPEDRLICHYCGYYSGIHFKCNRCGHEDLRAYGFGTEKLEHELKVLFPKARIARLDTDISRKKGQAIRILKRFSEHEIDILVGTQMITKGYDFPMVTLVGVIAADLSLAFPDFRAAERTFQIITQVAGRGKKEGKVIIQTFNPDHYAIKAATRHDYFSFFEEEKKLRRQLVYPPFSYLACLRFQGNNKDKTVEAVHRLGKEIKEMLKKWSKRGNEIQVLGPVEAPLSRLRGKFRWQILIKSKGASLLHLFLEGVEEMARKILKSRGVHLTIDIDPYQMI